MLIYLTIQHDYFVYYDFDFKIGEKFGEPRFLSQPRTHKLYILRHRTNNVYIYIHVTRL